MERSSRGVRWPIRFCGDRDRDRAIPLYASRRVPANPARQFELIFGVRHCQGLLYHDELTGLAARYANFVYHPTLTRPPEEWTGFTGRVQPHVLQALGERRDVDVYICGLREMVDDLRTQLKDAGLDRRASSRKVRLE